MQVQPISFKTTKKTAGVNNSHQPYSSSPISFGNNDDVFIPSNENNYEHRPINVAIRKRFFTTTMLGTMGDIHFIMNKKGKKLTGVIGEKPFELEIAKKPMGSVIKSYKGNIDNKPTYINTLFLNDGNQVYGNIGIRHMSLKKVQTETGHVYTGKYHDMPFEMDCKINPLVSTIKGYSGDEEFDFKISSKGMVGNFDADPKLLPLFLPLILEDMERENDYENNSDRQPYE